MGFKYSCMKSFLQDLSFMVILNVSLYNKNKIENTFVECTWYENIPWSKITNNELSPKHNFEMHCN